MRSTFFFFSDQWYLGMLECLNVCLKQHIATVFEEACL